MEVCQNISDHQEVQIKTQELVTGVQVSYRAGGLPANMFCPGNQDHLREITLFIFNVLSYNFKNEIQQQNFMDFSIHLFNFRTILKCVSGKSGCKYHLCANNLSEKFCHQCWPIADSMLSGHVYVSSERK